MTDIRELLTAIRAWEAADAVYRASEAAYVANETYDYDLWVARADAFTALDAAAKWYTDEWWEKDAIEALTQFVALAEHVGALEAALRPFVAAYSERLEHNNVYQRGGVSNDMVLYAYNDKEITIADVEKAQKALTSEPTAASASAKRGRGVDE